jgi:spore germination protein GerM
MRVRRLLAVAVLTAVSACGVGTEDAPQRAEDDSVPFGLLSPNAPTLVPPATAATTESVILYFIAGDRLSAVERRLDPPVSLDDIVVALAEPAGEGGPLRSAVGSPPLVAHLKLAGGVVQVDLAAGVAELGGDTQLLAIAQLVCTLTARPGVGQVSFTLGGQPVDVPRGDGTLTSGAVSRDDYAQLLS